MGNRPKTHYVAHNDFGEAAAIDKPAIHKLFCTTYC